MTALFGRAWRVVATALAFAVFGVGGAALGVVGAPLLALSTVDARVRQRRVQRAIHLSCRFFVWMMRTLGLLSYRVSGGERLLGCGRLIAANHPSLIDAVFLLALMPSVDCIAKRALWRNPFLGAVIRWAGYIPNLDAGQLLSECEHRLRAGRCLLVFPEGTRSVPGRHLPLKRGLARLALRSGAPIVPVCIECRPPTLTKGSPWYRVPPVRPQWTIEVGEPLWPRALVPEGLDPPVAARRLTREIERRLGLASPAPV